MATKRKKEEKTLEDIFIDKIRFAYEMEKMLVRDLPKLAKNAHNQMLKQTIEDHWGETDMHKERLENILDSLDLAHTGKKSAGFTMLLSEGMDAILNIESKAIRDAELAARAQDIEHYEISIYSTLVDWARILGYEDVADTLETTLYEEMAAEEMLADIALHDVNERAIVEENDE